MQSSLTTSPDYDIRYSRITDISYLRTWIIDPRVIQYFPFQHFQAHEIEFFTNNWISFSKYQASLTAIYNQKPCGIATIFLLPYKKVAHIGMLHILVDPIWQKKGIGSSLIRNIKHHAKNYFHLEFLNIEIMENNPIVSMLKSFGFYEVFRQEGFYKVDKTYLARITLEVAL